MKILFVAPHYYPYTGGVEHVVKSIAERLVRKGHEVVVLSGESQIKYIKFDEINGVKVIRWPTLSPSDAYHFPLNKAKLNNILANLAKHINIVHIHSAHTVFTVYSGLKLKQYNPDLNTIFTLHYHGTGHSLIRKLLWKIMWKEQVNKLIQKADKIHAVSNYEAKLIGESFPNIRDKVVVIPNGVNEDVFNYKWKGQNSDYILYAGRIERYKRLELLIDLAKKLKLKVIILGKGPYKEKVVKYANKKYPNHVEFYPPQPRTKYLEYIAGARYAANLSTREAYSIFIAEALSMGVPCIVSNTLYEIWSSLCNSIIKIPSYDALIMKCRLGNSLKWDNIVNSYIYKLYS